MANVADGALEELPETTPLQARELVAEGCTALLARFLVRYPICVGMLVPDMAPVVALYQ